MSDNDKLSETERRLLEAVPKALRDGVDLLRWWQQADADNSYEERYEEAAVFNRPEDKSYGFFDCVKLSSGRVRVNGNVQEMFYDEPKAPPGYEGTAVDWLDGQIREFILRYFMRVSDYRQPHPVPESDSAASSGLGMSGAHPEEDSAIEGFGFSQIHYKRRGDAEAGSFAEEERGAIVDLRRFDDEFEWIVLKNPIFSFGLDLKPFGKSGPQMRMPAKVFNYLVLSPDFVVNEERPEPGIRGRYGFGYAFVNDPEPSAFGYGPGKLEPAFEQMVWEIRDSGEITVRAVFVAEEPRGILNLSVDPLAWGFQLGKIVGGPAYEAVQPLKRFWDKLPLTNVTFDPVLPTVRMLNLVTAGQAAKRLGISKNHIVKEALFLHFLQHYQTIVGSLQTWRQIPDWTAGEETLPQFVVTGRSS